MGEGRQGEGALPLYVNYIVIEYACEACNIFPTATPYLSYAISSLFPESPNLFLVENETSIISI